MRRLMAGIAAVVIVLTACRAEPSADTTHLFYFHGRIVEEGLPAISPEHGEYQFADIVRALDTAETAVVARQRSRDPVIDDEVAVAVADIAALIDGGVPPGRIALVGASKGAFIAARVSDELENDKIGVVLIAGCAPHVVDFMLSNDVRLFGRVLEIRDRADEGAAPGCGRIVDASSGVSAHKSIVTNLGVGHGLLYRPYPEWIEPTLRWVTAD